MRYDVLAEKTDEKLLRSYYERCRDAFSGSREGSWIFSQWSDSELTRYKMAFALHQLDEKVSSFGSLEELEMKLAIAGC